jgi:hypothetical protein
MSISRILHRTYFFFVFFCLAVPVFGQGGSSGLSFMKIGVGSRALAMGETGVAGESLGTSLFYNPANSARDTHASIGFMHNAWIQDIATEYVGAVVPYEGWSLGVQLGLNSVSNIELRTVPGEAQGTFDSKGFFGGISAAIHITDNIDAGVTAKYLFEKIYVDVADGYAFDFGLRWAPFTSGEYANFRAGVALLNVGSMSPLKNEASQLPKMLRYGISHVLRFDDRINLGVEAAGLTLFNEKKTHVSLGAEMDYVKVLFLRAGFQSGYEVKAFSAGIGAMYSGVHFDYAFIPFQQSFGIAHAVTVSVIF